MAWKEGEEMRVVMLMMMKVMLIIMPYGDDDRRNDYVTESKTAFETVV